MAPTHYDILEVSVSASAEEIRLAYRRQAQRWHPDRKGGAHQQFLRIQDAYEVLSNASLRRDYDRSLKKSEAPLEPEEGPASSPLHSVLPGEPLHLLARVKIHDLFESAPVRLTGWVGHVCPRCQGQGCARCGQAGQVLHKRTWQVLRPARWRPTEFLRLAAAGHCGPFYPRPGDVFIELNPLPSHGWRWDRPRQRLEKAVRISEDLMRQGGPLEIVAPHGKAVIVQVPATAKPSTWVRLVGLGLGPVGSADAAWLYLHVPLRFSWPYRRLPSV